MSADAREVAYKDGRIWRITSNAGGFLYLPMVKYPIPKAGQTRVESKWKALSARRCFTLTEAKDVLDMLDFFLSRKMGNKVALTAANFMATYILDEVRARENSVCQYHPPLLDPLQVILKLYKKDEDKASRFFGVNRSTMMQRVAAYRRPISIEEQASQFNSQTPAARSAYPPTYTQHSKRPKISGSAFSPTVQGLPDALPGDEVKDLGRSPSAGNVNTAVSNTAAVDGTAILYNTTAADRAALPLVLPTPRQSQSHSSPAAAGLRQSLGVSSTGLAPGHLSNPALLQQEPMLSRVPNAATPTIISGLPVAPPLQAQQQLQQPLPPQPCSNLTQSSSPSSNSYMACHLVGHDGQWLGASFELQMGAPLGAGGFSRVYAANLLGPYTGQQTGSFFTTSTSAAAGSTVRNVILSKLPIGTVIAVKTGLCYDQLSAADAAPYTRQGWEELQCRVFVRESEVYQLTAGSPDVLTCFGLCKLELLTGTAAGGHSSNSSSNQWPLALLLERSEQTLEDYLGSRPRDPAETHAIMTAVAKIIMTLHRKGVIWRDLKASNLHLCRQRDGSLVVKTADFGLAYVVRHHGDYAHSVVGTKVVMAPEAKYGYTCDARMDLYSLGGLFMRTHFGHTPGSYLKGRPDVTLQQCEERLEDWEAELARPDCPYLPQVLPREREVLLGLVACNPAHRLDLALQFTERAEVPYFLEGPHGPPAWSSNNC